MNIETIVWYRYEDMKWAASLNDFDEPVGEGRSDIWCRECTVDKLTPKGLWVKLYQERKFIRLSARKKFAHPTKKEALEAFLARKSAQLRILQAQVRHVEAVMVLAKEKLSVS